MNHPSNQTPSAPSTLQSSASREIGTNVSKGSGASATDSRSADYYKAAEIQANLALDRGYGLNGALFLLDQPNTVEPVWGTESRCLWSKGEPLYVAAGPGRGKTTLCQQLALRRAGVKGDDLLGLPVEVDAGRVLYIAADRPRQAARSARRMVTESDREGLEIGLTFWPRSLPFAISSSPDSFLPWVQKFGEVGTVFIDSLFNVAPSIADEEGAANTNNAIQTVIRAGIEVVVIHHDRKATHDRGKPKLDDMYGGRALSGGAGSVLYLDGETGVMTVDLHHLKQPAGVVGPLEIRQLPRTGDFEVTNERNQ